MARTRVQVLLTGSLLGANLVGAVVVAVLCVWVVPDVEVVTGNLVVANLIAVPLYVVVASLVGVTWGTRSALGRLAWLWQGREPSEAEQRAALRVPGVLLRVQALLWVTAVVVFSILEPRVGRVDLIRLDLVVALGGAVTCATAYLLSELALRPVSARALASRPPHDLVVPGLLARSLLAWVLGGVVPAAGVVILAVLALVAPNGNPRRFIIAMLVLTLVLVLVGSLLTLLAARATVDPVLSVRAALSCIEEGSLDVVLPVYDGTELGLLQAGFNRMTMQLRERERIRELFGRHVGEEVARAALERTGAALGGEEREVSVLFVDVVGSTALAIRRPPAEVVDILNRFFTVVVDVVDRQGGFVNKFEGDAALAVFGAPGDLDDAAGRCLLAARTLASRLHQEVPDLVAAVGVATGSVVAGNIGAEHRFEYTVIGDPVNEAARLTELAKSDPVLVLASAVTVEKAAPREAARWSRHRAVILRGRDQPTMVCRPA